ASQQLPANSVEPSLLSENSFATVLSLDGGGVRGIVSEKMQKLLAEVLHEFDLTCAIFPREANMCSYIKKLKVARKLALSGGRTDERDTDNI
ncbi:hypothetical protein Tco_1321646, partial [Tanacetum coccineum]